jgi:hypothetical protein
MKKILSKNLKQTRKSELWKPDGIRQNSRKVIGTLVGTK